MGTDQLIAPTEPLYLCIHVQEFPAQALLRLRPGIARWPVAVLAGDPPLAEVCSANSRALRLGVLPGMTRAELDSFPGLHILRRSEPEERAARAALLEVAGAFTPRLEIQPSAASAFVLVLDMTGTARIFGSARQAAERVLLALKTISLFAHIAASANLHAAVSVAPTARRAPIVLPQGRERECLRDLPLAALNLSAQQAETLAIWGLQTLGELAALPEVDLVVRLGQEGNRLRRLARGEHPHLMVPEEPVFTLEEFLAFDAPIELMDSLLFVIGPMLDQLLARARNRALALSSLTLKLGLEGGGEHERTIKPAIPVFAREVFLKLLHLDLQAHPPPAGVMSIVVQAEPGDRSKVQLGLFAPQLPEPVRLDVTLARIAALVGEDRVGRARLLDTHRPESFSMERFVVAGAKPDPELVRTPRHTFALRRCRPPQTLAVRHDAQRPASFYLQGKLYRVEEAYGPWRRSGDWWSAGAWSQEEWDVRAASDAGPALLCLISHDLLCRHWRLEGLYD